MTLILLKRYWQPLLLLLIVILSLVAIKWYGANQYNKGVNNATATLQAKFDVINTKQVAKMQAESAKYQADKTKRDQEQDIQYVEVEKIILKPVYLTDCIDDDGLSEINRAASGQ